MQSDTIDQVRRFNRAVMQRIGTLGDRFLSLDRPYGEARLLYEIGPKGADVRDLRARLGLDSGYVSRLLRALEREGLIATEPSEADRRVRRITLTGKGLAAFAEIDRAGDAFAKRVLAPLGTRQRERLVAAMTEVETLMRAFAVVIRPEPASSGDAQYCLETYYREIARRFDAGFDPANGLPTGVKDMTPPNGVFLMARLDGRPVGCGALLFEDGAGHIRRMWIDQDVRGLGLGKRMLEALEDQARDAGLDTVRLETNRALTEARALYRRAGYVDVMPFNDEAYAHYWFEKRGLLKGG